VVTGRRMVRMFSMEFCIGVRIGVQRGVDHTVDPFLFGVGWNPPWRMEGYEVGWSSKLAVGVGKEVLFSSHPSKPFLLAFSPFITCWRC
jgi:hypothetical protein